MHFPDDAEPALYESYGHDHGGPLDEEQAAQEQDSTRCTPRSLAGGDEERSLLNVHPAGEAAGAAYRAWGAQGRRGAPVDRGRVHEVLVLQLR